MKEKIMNRRRLLTSLGLLAGTTYAAPLIFNISEARASSCGGGSSGGGGGGPSAASARRRSRTPSTPSTASGPSGAESGPSSQTCTDVLGASVRCNPT